MLLDIIERLLAGQLRPLDRDIILEMNAAHKVVHRILCWASSLVDKRVYPIQPDSDYEYWYLESSLEEYEPRKHLTTPHCHIITEGKSFRYKWVAWCEYLAYRLLPLHD